MRTDPYWWDAAPREAPGDAPVPAEADIAIAGAGYAGLSAALTLARAGRSVVVLDAEAPGFGGSSRSGGMVGHGHRLSYAALTERFGRDKALALLAEGVASLDFVVDLIAREGIDARFGRVGRYRGAATPAAYETLAREAEALTRDLGMAIEVLPRAEQRRELASDLYFGGLVFHGHGGLHPALFHTGLLAVARNAGVTVVGHTPVAGIRRDGAGFEVAHARGVVRAREVIVATNGYSANAFGPLSRRVVGTPSYMIATEPLGANRVTSLIPNARMIVETAASHLYFRPSPDGERIVLGGRAALHRIPLEEAARRLKGHLVRVFPELADVGLSHAWTGFVAMTRSDLPGIGQRDGVWYAMGCNGSGVALMPYLGHKVALKLLGDPAGATAYDDIDLPAVPFYDGRPWFLPAVTYWWRAKDALARLRG